MKEKREEEKREERGRDEEKENKDPIVVETKNNFQIKIL